MSVTCRDVVELLSDYVEGDLPPEYATLLDEHMADCPNCERFLRSLQTTINWTHRMKASEVPEDVLERLRAFLGTYTQKSGR